MERKVYGYLNSNGRYIISSLRGGGSLMKGRDVTIIMNSDEVQISS